jgi:hypothetical protein
MTILEIIKERAEKSKPKPNVYNIWENSPFEEPIKGRTSDERGYYGEGLVNDCVSKLTNFECKWLRDSNTSQEDGIYDILINGYRTEVKTASASLDKKTGKILYKFQHENIYKENVWDKLVLVDIEPNGVYWTILNHSEMNFEGRHPILKTSATKHLSAYKFDTAYSTKSKNGCNLNRGITAGITIYVPNNADSSELSSFLIKHLS